ncbi:type I-C CRISPR-associated protein Cas7/Csd2 [Porphyromonas pogonae]|uniref:type I-C CRISPR-associated protein Cas7/Csd2 n=1 Tax=Porphyromonas pogonae TaxID=867595 RepID=UPI002E79BB91|nr:type I-C CRISPR-associated protein Cas7/Csd2 [Porphyromonas pogonae]
MEQINQTTVDKRYDFIYLYEVTDGNPNGDPDASNTPRIDPETGQGLVSDVCLKRKVRNYVSVKKGLNEPGYRNFIQEKAVLNRLITEGFDKANPNQDKSTQDDKKDKQLKKVKEENARKVMCQDYYDIRTFGAVMTTGKKETVDSDEDNKVKTKSKTGEKGKAEKTAGQVRGPVQLTFSRSIDPIFSNEHTITRMAVTSEKDEEKEQTMGRKSTVSYGLYLCRGFITPHFAEDTGFTQSDLDLFWEALINMFEIDHSAARGLMSARRLIVFEHDSKLGNAPAFELFDRINVNLVNQEKPARRFDDYQITINDKNLPKGIKVYDLITGWSNDNESKQ